MLLELLAAGIHDLKIAVQIGVFGDLDAIEDDLSKLLKKLFPAATGPPDLLLKDIQSLLDPGLDFLRDELGPVLPEDVGEMLEGIV